MAAKTQRVEAIRSFRRAGNDVGAGSVLDLDMPTALELRTAKKVQFAASDAKVVSLPVPVKQKKPSAEEQQRELVELQRQQIESLLGLAASLKTLVETLTAEKPSKGKGNA